LHSDRIGGRCGPRLLDGNPAFPARARGYARKLSGHKTEAVYRRYAIVFEADLAEGVKKLAAMPSRTVSRTIDRKAGVAAG
jgi:hypothetical protein